jgi:hypothetical protein
VDNLGQFIREKQVNGVIATTELLLSSPAGEKLRATCQANSVWVRVLRLEFELID